MGEEGLEALRKEESRVERLLSDGKMSVIKQDELRYDVSHKIIPVNNFFIKCSNRRTKNILRAFDSGIAMEQRRDEL